MCANSMFQCNKIILQHAKIAPKRQEKDKNNNNNNNDNNNNNNKTWLK